MADKTAFEIPDQMRAFADKSVDQAKKAFDDFMNATLDPSNCKAGVSSRR